MDFHITQDVRRDTSKVVVDNADSGTFDLSFQDPSTLVETKISGIVAGCTADEMKAKI